MKKIQKRKVSRNKKQINNHRSTFGVELQFSQQKMLLKGTGRILSPRRNTQELNGVKTEISVTRQLQNHETRKLIECYKPLKRKRHLKGMVTLVGWMPNIITSLFRIFQQLYQDFLPNHCLYNQSNLPILIKRIVQFQPSPCPIQICLVQAGRKTMPIEQVKSNKCPYTCARTQ